MGHHHGGSRSGRGAMGAVALGLLVTVLAGCTEEPVAEGVGDVAGGDAEAPDLGTKPELVTILPDDRGDPPSSLQVEDLVVGDGEPAERGARLTVHFVGASWSSGQEFDSTWDREQPYAFTLGEGDVIEAWDEGLVGMRVGGRRALIVPPEFAYGDRGSSAGIAPGETIVFIVDLLEVEPS